MRMPWPFANAARLRQLEEENGRLRHVRAFQVNLYLGTEKRFSWAFVPTSVLIYNLADATMIDRVEIK